MWQHPRIGVSTKEVVGADKEVERGATVHTLKPGVSGSVLLLQ